MRHRARSAARRLALALSLVAALAGVAVAAPEKTAGGIRFTYTDPNAKSVAWAGLFNGWNTSANPMTKGTDGVWSAVVALPPGEHEYKFVVDGSWIADPENTATRGDYGNSLVIVGDDGNLKKVAATANTAFNPKILLGGRGIATYRLVRNTTSKRFELLSPGFDFGLKFDIRVSDLMTARLILNNNNALAYNSPLVLERGSIEFHGRSLQIMAFDNMPIETWNDPLHLVGNIGIYGFRYGYNRQGFLFRAARAGFDTQLLYADNFQTGGQTYPSVTLDVNDFLIGFPVVPSGGGYAGVVGAAKYAVATTVGDGNENTLAIRTQRNLPFGLHVGASVRSDRGFDLSTVAQARLTAPDKLSLTFVQSDQEWWGGGADVAWKGARGFSARGEFLTGVKRINGLRSLGTLEFDVVADANGLTPVGSNIVPVADPEPEDHDLDRSNRWLAGGEWIESHGDIRLQASIEGESHDYRFVDDSLNSSTQLLRVQWDRNWRYYLNRELLTGLGLEWQTFDYDPRTPWTKQLWFPEGNFWFEHGEHVVRFDRLVMLGGDDVVSIKPSLELPVWRRRNARIGWSGTFNTQSLSKQPKFSENIFRLGVDVMSDIRLSTDVRWVKYDDPVLGLFHGYQSSFTQVAYRVAPDIHLALGFGVDPVVSYRLGVDENAMIGRDLFLFDQGANAANAQLDYFGLGAKIDLAESALRDIRIIQIKATVDF